MMSWLIAIYVALVVLRLPVYTTWMWIHGTRRFSSPWALFREATKHFDAAAYWRSCYDLLIWPIVVTLQIVSGILQALASIIEEPWYTIFWPGNWFKK